MMQRRRELVALSMGLALASGGCAAPFSATTGSPRTVVARAVAGTVVALDPGQALAAVNVYRRGYGLAPVRLDPAVTDAARIQSHAMAQQGVMSHSAGSDFRSRLLASGVGRTTAVENIAWGQRSFAEAMASWRNSSGHAQNMQSPEVTRLGVAMANTSNGAYWTLVLAGDVPG